MVIGPLVLRSGFHWYSPLPSGFSISGVKSFGASIMPGFAAKRGCAFVSSPITTVPPLPVIPKSSVEKSYGIRMQPWLAGYPGRLPECIAVHLHVSRCMFGIGALSYFLERWVCFFSRIVKTPVGVWWLF